VIDRLDPKTFSRRALDLVSRDGVATGVPSDGWGQLLLYRRDWFDAAGLRRPRTLADVLHAAAKLDRPGRAGIAVATAPGDAFTAESFEHVALAAGCELVDEDGEVLLDSPQCVAALRTYRDLARHGPPGTQDVESTRDAYFSGRAAMVFWSPFLLDGLAGLRDDDLEACAPCRRSPGFLARRSGLVGALAAPGGMSQFGSVSTFNITTTADTDAAQQLVEHLMSDGYLQWLGLAPQGKVPARAGDASDPGRFTRGWSALRVGVTRRAPLNAYYSASKLHALSAGVKSFDRWGFAQGQGALVGGLSGEQPVAEAAAAVIAGEDPARAARDARDIVEEIASTLE
jgi:multiple sugar transport system substrate-binding protein